MTAPLSLEALRATLEAKGVVGAGGAGFPAHLKLRENARAVIANGAECEPLLNGDKLLLAQHGAEILAGLALVTGATGAAEGILALKPPSDPAFLANLQAKIPPGANLRLFGLEAFYPAGDEVVLVQEVLGETLPQGARPADVGLIVFNVETLYNIYRACHEDAAVTHKVVAVAGAVAQPVTLRAPVGLSVAAAIAAAGGPTRSDYAVIIGGPMTGRLAEGGETVGPTTNGILVLPAHHPAVALRRSPLQQSLRRAFSVCSQCRMCTDLCPRALLGHDIAPHLLMRSVIAGDAENISPYLGARHCVGCGVCELYACHQGLRPRQMALTFKKQLSAYPTAGANDAGSERPLAAGRNAHPLRTARRVPSGRLLARLGLAGYRNGTRIVPYEEVAKS